jgi:hypothetical protein
MSSLIKRNTPKTPEISAPITSTTPEVTEAASAEAARLKKKRGYASTILTAPEGVTGETTTKKETLG